MIRYGLHFISALILASGLSAHAERNDGIDLIDNHRYEDAIKLYTQRIAQNPDDTESRVLLASTYAARNDIALVKFLNVVRVIKSAPSSKKEEGLDALMSELNLVFGAIVALPDLPPASGVRDIQTAIAVMPDNIHASYGYYLYRAILRLVVIKDDLRFRSRLVPTPKTCTVSEGSMQVWLDSLLTSLVSAVSDVEKGTKDPKARLSIKKIEDDLLQLISSPDSEPASKTDMNEMPAPLKRLYPC